MVVPVQPEDYGAQGLKAIRRTIARVQAEANAGLALIGYLVTMFNKALSVHVTYEGYLRELHGDDVFAAVDPAREGLQGGRDVPQADRRVQAAVGRGQGDGRPGRRVPGPARRADPASGSDDCPEGRLMARFNESMRGNVAGSMSGDRFTGEPAGFARRHGRPWNARGTGGGGSTRRA